MRRGLVVAVLAASQWTASALAQTPQPAPRPPAVAAQQPASQPAAQMPDAVAMIIMIRSTLVALNQANQTGNYSVLRDLGAPAFQASNNPAQLAVAFTALRDQRLDIASVLAVTPELAETPTIDQNNILKLTGFFPTEPLRINFQMAFQLVAGTWRPIALAVGANQPQAPAQPVADATPKKPAPARKQ